MTNEAERIARGLTKAQRELLPHLSLGGVEARELPWTVRNYPRYRDDRLITQAKRGGRRFYSLTPSA